MVSLMPVIVTIATALKKNDFKCVLPDVKEASFFITKGHVTTFS